MKRKAVFLDRDGVINKMINIDGNWDSPMKPDEFIFRKGIFRLVRIINSMGFHAIIITNQPCIAKQKCSVRDLKDIDLYIINSMTRRDCIIDRIYTCKHHPDSQIKLLRRKCNCRKPNPGLINRAIKEFNIDSNESYMIGDRIVDIEAGSRAGCKSILLKWDKADYEKAVTHQRNPPDYSFTSISKLIHFFKELT